MREVCHMCTAWEVVVVVCFTVLGGTAMGCNAAQHSQRL